MGQQQSSSIAWKYDEDKDLDNIRTQNPAITWQQLALFLNRRHHEDTPVRTAQEVRERYAQIAGEENDDDTPQKSGINSHTAVITDTTPAEEQASQPQLTQAQSDLRAHYLAWKSEPRTAPGISTYNEYARTYFRRPAVSSWYRIVPGPLVRHGTSGIEVEEEDGNDEACDQDTPGKSNHGSKEAD
ncbi:hypothetical protein FKW77_008751 [Venturia effusa]|uniref:Uncharacterized protein n=1 Tax=Venturia effusa TaxID=50376 RepID=A0A517LED5_9PEZI|nr:hypothetical protein FKW77_008751 [Venturia effusa]